MAEKLDPVAWNDQVKDCRSIDRTQTVGIVLCLLGYVATFYLMHLGVIGKLARDFYVITLVPTAMLSAVLFTATQLVRKQEYQALYRMAQRAIVLRAPGHLPCVFLEDKDGNLLTWGYRLSIPPNGFPREFRNFKSTHEIEFPVELRGMDFINFRAEFSLQDTNPRQLFHLFPKGFWEWEDMARKKLQEISDAWLAQNPKAEPPQIIPLNAGDFAPYSCASALVYAEGPLYGDDGLIPT